MKKIVLKHKNIIYTCLGLLLFVVIWEIIAYSTNLSFLPDFFICIKDTLFLFADKTAMMSLLMTTVRLIISFAISALLGVILGVLSGYYEPIGKILNPIMSILRSLPTIALAMVLVIFVSSFSLYVTSIIIFPIIYQASKEGSEKAYKKFEYELQLKGKNNIRNITDVILPLSIPHILLGFIQSLGLGLKVEIMAETLAYKSNFYGIGKALSNCYNQVEYQKMMSYVMLSIIIGLLFDLSLHFIKKKIKA